MMRELPLKDNLTILTTPTENKLCIFSKEKATIKIFEEDKIIHTFENELFEQKEIKIHEIMMYKNEWY
ncbi:SufE protein, partial [Enterococcus casseliflavus]